MTATTKSPTAEADRKGTILRAAIEVFSKKGYHGCRIADVAKEAGVAYGLVYHYYSNKDELLQSVFEYGWTGLVTRLTERALQGKTVDEKVRGIVSVAFDAYKTDPRAVKVLILEIGRSPAGQSVNRGSAFGGTIEMVSTIFRDGQKRGELDPKLEPLICAAMLFGAIEMGLTAFIMGLLDRKPETVDQAARQVADTFLGGALGDGTWKNEKSATKSRALKRA
ncbi:MAG: TetR/AcrR family transcriptional regulator [Archangiaceae bacterium]|nr:TetR/AcrR family transcriptional regulator [Archangiaceae bacterium]